MSDEIARVDDISLTTIIAKTAFSLPSVEFALQTSLKRWEEASFYAFSLSASSALTGF